MVFYHNYRESKRRKRNMDGRKDYYYDPVNHYYTYGGAQSTINTDGDDWYEPPKKPGKERKERKKFELTGSKLLALALALVLLCGIAGFGGAKLAGAGKVTIAQENTVESAGFDLEKDTGSKMTVQQIAKKVTGSVVSIKTESVAQSSWIREYVTQGAGSGVIFKEDGYIITNNHVVEGARKITVSIDDSEKEYEAKIVGTDASNDVAVIKIDAKGLTAATIGQSDKLVAGDMAVVVGNPLGELGDSVSAGVISSTSRKLTLEDQQMDLIQTDATINPGNSGGGLFNGSGQLVGLVVAKSSGSNVEGLGFAIPMKTAMQSAQNILDGKVNDNAKQEQQQEQVPDSEDYGWDEWPGEDNGGGSFFDFFF